VQNSRNMALSSLAMASLLSGCGSIAATSSSWPAGGALPQHVHTNAVIPASVVNATRSKLWVDTLHDSCVTVKIIGLEINPGSLWNGEIHTTPSCTPVTFRLKFWNWNAEGADVQFIENARDGTWHAIVLYDRKIRILLNQPLHIIARNI
jgi:hypothetical protein